MSMVFKNIDRHVLGAALRRRVNAVEQPVGPHVGGPEVENRQLQLAPSIIESQGRVVVEISNRRTLTVRAFLIEDPEGYTVEFFQWTNEGIKTK